MDAGLLIAQVGRSGGTWLSQQLRLDDRWDVRHEHGGFDSNREPLSVIHRRLMVPYYCDVSHLHNEVAVSIPCKKAVILRHPKEVFDSYAARTQESKTRFLNKVDGMYLGLDMLLERGATLIQFKKMVEDPAYFEWVTSLIGFKVPMEKVSWGPVNIRVKRSSMPASWRGSLQRNAMRVWERWMHGTS